MERAKDEKKVQEQQQLQQIEELQTKLQDMERQINEVNSREADSLNLNSQLKQQIDQFESHMEETELRNEQQDQ